jgi:hypothetical protein
MNPRTKNLTLAGGGVVLIGFVAVNTFVAPAAPQSAPQPSDALGLAEPAPSPSRAGEDLADPAMARSPAASASPAGGVAVPARRSYAIGLHDLAGFPPDAAPGEPLELWVTWEPPVTRGPRLQKLISDVVVERTIPGSVPEAPVTVLLSVPVGRVGDLIYADTFGKLSVVLPN